MFYGAETSLVCIFSVSGAVGAVAPSVLWRDTRVDLLYGDALCRDLSLVFPFYIFNRARGQLADNQRTTSQEPVQWAALQKQAPHREYGLFPRRHQRLPQQQKFPTHHPERRFKILIYTYC